MKILLAIDDSKCSELAIDNLIKLYKPVETEVLVLHAIESAKLTPISYAYGLGPMFVQDYNGIAQQWTKHGEELVTRTRDRLQAAWFKTTTQVVEGDAKEVILDWVAKWNPDVVVLGSHGKKGLDRVLLGSVSETIARQASCSVEIVRGPAATA